MLYILIAAIALGVGSYIYNGGTPEPRDSEYLRVYKITHANKLSDEAILQERKEDEVTRLKWKATNSMLDDELSRRGLNANEYKMQKALDQTLFYNKHYDEDMSVSDFVDMQYPKSK